MEKPATAPHALSESLTLTSYYVYTRKREHDRRTAATGAQRTHVQNRRESNMTACHWQCAT